jgi:hypothetical protein
MTLPLFNSIASWLLKKRLHQIELFVKYPADVQNELLLKLVDMAAFTEFGRRIDLKRWRPIRQFAETGSD